jgi:peptidoglycan/xylan/chitin deacetylase (PgdA/CDA1 family)
MGNRVKHIVIAVAAFAIMSGLVVRMPGQAQQTPGSGGQPGTKFTEDQIKQKVAGARAGKKLVPKWPNGAKVAVVLSYDIDNESPLLDRDNLAPTALSETEYGATSGIPRILALLDRLNLPATFYVPAVSAMLGPDMIPAIKKSGRHEIALHGWIHESLPELNNAAEEERLLKQSIDYLTKASGKKPVGTRAGAWALSQYSLDIIRKAGLLYDSSMMARDEPYDIMVNGKDSGLLELPVSWIEDDAPYFGRTGALPSPELIFSVYRDEFDMAYQEGSFLMLTFHPHISGRRSRMVHMAKLFEYMKSKPGVWFATSEQVANYIKKNAPATSVQ